MNLLNLKDKNGNELFDGCIIFGAPPEETEMFNFNLGFSANNPNNFSEIDMYACEYGYVKNITQEIIANFELVGATKDNLHLLECD